MEEEERILRLGLTTRGYELGSSGHVPLAQLLRYLEHIRWQTMTREGPIPIRRYWGVGVVRAQELEVFHQISFDVELELSLWVSRVGRTSLAMSHDITRVADGAVVARSTATVVALDEQRRPRPISSDARKYIVERELARVARPTGVAPAECWAHEITIRPSDQDLQQHVNHARYAELVDDTRLLCARAGGYGAGRWDGPVSRLYLQYDREARLGESLKARTWRVVDTERDLEIELSTPAGVVTRARIELAAPTTLV